MAYETIEQAPAIGDFTLLAEHQERTPGTFFGGKPVLHLHCAESRLRIAAVDLASQPDFAALESGNGNRIENEVVEIPELEVWVNSRNLTIFSPGTSTGLQILYPTISIHAQDNDAVLLELNLTDANSMDEDLLFLQVRLVPIKIAHHGSSSPSDHDPESERLQNGGQQGQPNGSEASPVAQVYNAISACQELNPDPMSDDEDHGYGIDATAPGATGWITSENMHDFVGEDGEFRMPDGVAVLGGEDDEEEGNEEEASLGHGAGRRRTAAEVDDDQTGAEEEVKWQRTG
nr:hypothetical protein CFP56_30885 [Quercus suber]